MYLFCGTVTQEVVLQPVLPISPSGVSSLMYCLSTIRLLTTLTTENYKGGEEPFSDQQQHIQDEHETIGNRSKGCPGWAKSIDELLLHPVNDVATSQLFEARWGNDDGRTQFWKILGDSKHLTESNFMILTKSSLNIDTNKP